MKRYTTAWLNDVLVTLFMEAGASREVSETTSSILIEGDLLGHHTHGIKLANGYLRDLKSGHACGDHTALSVKNQPCRGGVRRPLHSGALLGTASTRAKRYRRPTIGHWYC